jgi:hypothetical protein
MLVRFGKFGDTSIHVKLEDVDLGRAFRILLKYRNLAGST